MGSVGCHPLVCRAAVCASSLARRSRVRLSYAPSGAFLKFKWIPMACAMGYFLSPFGLTLHHVSVWLVWQLPPERLNAAQVPHTLRSPLLL